MHVKSLIKVESKKKGKKKKGKKKKTTSQSCEMVLNIIPPLLCSFLAKIPQTVPKGQGWALPQQVPAISMYKLVNECRL